MSRPILLALTIAALTISTVALVRPAPAQGTAAKAVPANIAVIDMEKVFNSLTERNDLQEQLKTYLGQLQADVARLEKDAKDQTTAAQALPDGSGDKLAAVAKAAEAQISLRARREVAEAMIDQRSAAMFRQVSAKIQAAAKKMAEQRGYTLVISTDENVTIPPTAGAQEANRVIATRRLVFASPAHDVTQDLIQLLNAEYAAGAKTPGSSSIIGTPAPAPAGR